MDETHPQRPINTYGETKLAVERALPHFERAYGMRSVALRYFNAAGADPGRRDRRGPRSRRAPDSARDRAAPAAAPLTVFGDDYATPDGTCMRDYVHVADLADAHLALAGRLEQADRRHPSISATATASRSGR